MKVINNKYIIKIFPLYTKQIVLTICVFGILMIIQMFKGGEIETVDTIYRPNFQENTMKYKLYYQVDDDDIQEFDVNVRSIKASEEELKTYLNKINQEFEIQFHQAYNQLIEGDRDSMMELPLKLETSYKDCEIRYFTDEVVEIDALGWIDPQYMNQRIELPYSISYNKVNKTGKLQIYIDKEQVSQAYLTSYNKYKLEESIRMLELDTSAQQISLPKDKNVTFYKTYLPVEKGKYPVYIILLVLGLSFLSHYEIRHQKELFEKEKRIQLMYFLNNFILMFHSGLTIQKSFCLSIDNRVHTLEKDKKISAYFQKWQKMIQQDRAFEEVVDDFQKCFSLIEGRRFCRLIMQNLRQGDHHLTLQLTTLSEGMWDQRIRHARKESEKASSKLVFPMLIIFIVILLITIMPSFMEVNRM